MELHVLHDESGAIIAAVQLHHDLSQDVTMGRQSTPVPRPVPQEGQYTANVKVPDEFAHLSLIEVCNRLVVEGREGNAVLKPRESNQSLDSAGK